MALVGVLGAQVRVGREQLLHDRQVAAIVDISRRIGNLAWGRYRGVSGELPDADAMDDADAPDPDAAPGEISDAPAADNPRRQPPSTTLSAARPRARMMLDE